MFDGISVGIDVGFVDDNSVGEDECIKEGLQDGTFDIDGISESNDDGIWVCFCDGSSDGGFESKLLGVSECSFDGLCDISKVGFVDNIKVLIDGTIDAFDEGPDDNDKDGIFDNIKVGFELGLGDGIADGYEEN